MQSPPDRLGLRHYVTALDVGAALKRPGSLRHDALTVVDLVPSRPALVHSVRAEAIAKRADYSRPHTLIAGPTAFTWAR